MRALYTAALAAMAPAMLARLWWRGAREPGYRQAVGERFGRYRTAVRGPVLWVHAVSVGEVRAAAPLVAGLRAAWPGEPVLVTCVTAAGRQTIAQLWGEAVQTAWLPWDFPGAVRRFLAHFRPRIGIFMETEVWPNLLAGCAAQGVPMVLANARLSQHSARRYARLRSLFAPAFGRLCCVCAQSTEDAERLAAAGARAVRVTGNLKFDVEPDPAAASRGRAWREALGRSVVLLASTREGEEATLLGALEALPAQVLIVIVPRHPRRFDEVAALLAARAHPAARRSRGEAPAPWQRVYLGDTLGEMAFWYAAAEVAVMGGSFGPYGGQNLIEACAAGTPVVIGPSTHNFAEPVRLALAEGAALAVRDAQEASRAVAGLLADAPRRQAMGEAGRRLCALHRGATARHLEAIAEVLGGRRSVA